TASDPVALGWVASLARPASNMTGATQLNMELGPKRLELMRQLLPDAASIALVVNPSNPRVAEVQTHNAPEAARPLGLPRQILQPSRVGEFDNIAAGLSKRSVGLVIAGGDSFFLSESAALAAITLRHAVPTVFLGREFTAAGGLISYGGSVADSYHLA